MLPPQPVFSTAKSLGKGGRVVNFFQRGYYSSSKKSTRGVNLSGVKGLGLGYGLAPRLDLYFFLEQQEKTIPTLAVKYALYRGAYFFSSLTAAYSRSNRYFDDEKSNYQFMQLGILNTYYWQRWMGTAHLSLNNAVWKSRYNSNKPSLNNAKSQFRIIIPGKGNIFYQQLDLSSQYRLWGQLSFGPFVNFLLHHNSYGDVEIEFIDRKIFSSFFWGLNLSFYF